MAMDMTRFGLGPGVTLYVQSTKKYKTTSVYVYMHSPLARETVTATALVPMALVRGSREFPSTAALARHLDELYGAAIGGDVGQRGEVQSLLFRLNIPNEKFIPGENGLLERGMRTFASVLLDPLVEAHGFKADYVAQEKKNLGQMIEGLINSKPAYARQKCLEVMCKDEPYSLYRYGRREDLDGISAADVYQRYQTLLKTAPIDIFVVGDVTDQEALGLVSRHLRFPESDNRRLPTTSVRREAGGMQKAEESHALNQGVLVVGMRTGAVVTDDQYFPLLVAGGVLGSYSHSKLFENVREKHSLAYYAYSSLDTTKGVALMYAGIDFDNYEKTVDIMLEQIKELQAGNISDYELDATQRSLVNDVLAAEDRPGQMVDLAVAGVLTGRPLSLQERVEGIRTVTKEQIASVAQRFQPEAVFFLTNNERGQQ